MLAATGCGGDAGGGTDGGGGARGLESEDFFIDPQAEDLYTVGVMEGEDWEMFGMVAGAAFAEDGSLYLLDGEAGRIIVLDPEGRFVRTVASPGDGPGELSSPLSLALFDDGRIGVSDLARGIQVFSPDGEFLDAARFDLMSGAPGPTIFPLPDHSFLSASLAGNFMRVLQGGEPPPPSRPITRFRLDETQETFYTSWAPPPSGQTQTASSGGAGVRFSAREAFPPPLSFAVLDDGGVALVDSIDYRIKLLDAAGTVTRTLERPIEPIPVTDEIREAEIEARIEFNRGATIRMVSVGSTSGGGTMRLAPPSAESREESLRNMRFPEVIPVIGDIAVDRGNRLWVTRTSLPGELPSTDILTVDGQYLGTIPPGGLTVPEAFGPDGRLAYIEADELGIITVRVARLAGDETLESAAMR